MKHAGRIFVLPVLALVLASAGAAQAQQRERVQFRFNWIVNGQHAPFFLAQEKGYWLEEGLDVKLNEGKGTQISLNVVANGVEQFSIADLATSLKAVVQGMPVKAIFAFNQLSPMAVISQPEANIRSPRDLVGKTIATSAASSSRQIFPALLKAHNVDIDKIRLVMVDGGTEAAILRAKKADAVLLYFFDYGPILESQGVKHSILKYSDWGVNLLGTGIITHPRTLAERPEFVRRFLRAAQRAFQQAVRNPEEAVAAQLKHWERARAKEVEQRILLNSLSMLYTPNSKGLPIGGMAKKDWESTQDLLRQYGGLPKALPVEQYYTNDFLSPIMSP